MKRVFILLAVLLMCFDFVSAQVTYTPPSGYTPFYRLRMWAQGAKAGADSLNQNWKDIDSIMYNLVVNVDPRYFSWKDANHDTLTLNLSSFGTIGFADGENLFLPFHTSPYTLLGTNAVATTTGGYIVFKWSSRIDTMMTQYQYRSYRSAVETFTGAKTFSGAVTFNNTETHGGASAHNGAETFNSTSTFNVVPSNLYYYRTLFESTQAAAMGTVTPITPVNKDSTYILNGTPGSTVEYDAIATGWFNKHSTDQAIVAKAYAHQQGADADYDFVSFGLRIEVGDSLATGDVGNYLETGISSTTKYVTNTSSSISDISNNIPVRWTVYARVAVKSGKTPPYAIILKNISVVLKSKFTNGW